MWPCVFLDLIHVMCWLFHLLSAWVLFSIQWAALTFLIPQDWTRAWGDHWRIVILGLGFIQCFVGILWFIVRDPQGRMSLSRRRMRQRINLLSFQLRGPALGDRAGISSFQNKVMSESVRALKDSVCGIWAWRRMWAALGLGALCVFSSPAPREFYVFFLKGIWSSKIVYGIDHARLQFPGYTEWKPKEWENFGVFPIRINFIRGSSFAATFSDKLASSSNGDIRIRVGSALLLPERDVGPTQFRAQFQLSDDASLAIQRCEWDRFWETSPPLFFFERTPDKVPEVEVVYMSESDKITEGQMAPIRIRATDDFGIRRVALRITQEDRSVEELIKYYSKPQPSHDEMFEWDTTGVPLQSGPFTLEVVVRDASPEERRPNEGVSSKGHFVFETLESYYQKFSALIEKWIKQTDEQVAEVDRARDGEVEFGSYMKDGDSIAKEVEELARSTDIHEVLSQWNFIKLKLEPFDRDHIPLRGDMREGVMSALKNFSSLLRNLLQRQNDERQEELGAAVWNSFEAFRESHKQQSEHNDRQRKMFREKLQKNLATWMKTFDGLEDDRLKEWSEQSKLQEKLSGVEKRGEKTDARELESMEKELAEGMALWEQASVERDQKRLEEMKQKLGRIADTIQSIVGQQLAIRKATEPLDKNATDSQWKDVENGERNLVVDMEPALTSSLEDVQDDPMIQMALQGVFRKATQFMEEAGDKMPGHKWEESIKNQDMAVRTLLGAASRMQQMMQQMGQRAQFSRGSHRERGNYFKKTLNGPFGGPTEYRDALRKTLREERSSPLNGRERKTFYQRLVK